MSEELKPCPFCGGKAERAYNDLHDDMSMTRCVSCGAEAYGRKWQARVNPLDGARQLPFAREALGRFVREAWVRWAETQLSPKPSWLVPYDELSEADKEADRQIGEAVARWTLIGDAASASEAINDAARYRFLRDNCSSHYPMTYEQPAEWSIGWEFQQATPAEAYGSFDKWIDADIEAYRQRQDELDAEDPL